LDFTTTCTFLEKRGNFSELGVSEKRLLRKALGSGTEKNLSQLNKFKNKSANAYLQAHLTSLLFESKKCKYMQ